MGQSKREAIKKTIKKQSNKKEGEATNKPQKGGFYGEEHFYSIKFFKNIFNFFTPTTTLTTTKYNIK